MTKRAHHRVAGLTALALLLVASSLPAADPAEPAASDRIAVAFDEQSHTATLRIATPGGALRWSDLLRGLARVKGFDDAALAGLLPDEALNLNHLAARFAVIGIDAGLGDEIDLSIEYDEGAVAGLKVTLDELALLESQRRLKQRLRRATLGAWRNLTGAERRAWGLSLPDGWEASAKDKPIVIVVHGLHSDADHHKQFIDDLRQRGWTVGTFAYPNDGPIEPAGQRLARRLRSIEADHPEARFDLVTWSMGGLVARVAIEDPQIAPGNVRRLIMVGPPNHGSQMARFAFGLEIIEHLQGLANEDAGTRLFRAVEDGLSEASVDLMPGSAFLQKINRRGRNEEVRYSILLGTSAPLTAAQLEQLREQLKQAGEANRYVRFFGGKVDRWLADMGEVVAGRGDGAVSVERGKLEGVQDIATMPFDHVTALQGPGRDGVEARLRKAIMDRLGDEDE